MTATRVGASASVDRTEVRAVARRERAERCASRDTAPVRRSRMVQALGPHRCGCWGGIKRPLQRVRMVGGVMLAAGILYLLIGLVFMHNAQGSPDQGSEALRVKVTSRREGCITHVYVTNAELSEVTMTMCFSTKNLKSSVEFPYTTTFKPGETEAFTLTPIVTNQAWEFSYTNYYKLGSCEAVHDDGYLYGLPYPGGDAYRVSQGYGGKFSHTGANQYAVDWTMPEGTPILAARGGLVVRVKDDSDVGGGSIKFDRHNNFVIIRHDDGTLGHYCHLKQGGLKVRAGERVEAGQVIALSGNTGFSTGAHLHFAVFKLKSGRERATIPVKFENEDGMAVTLLEGRKYRAPEMRGTERLVQAPDAGSDSRRLLRLRGAARGSGGGE